MISVLLNIVPDEGHEARLQAALALVESQGGHITCVQTITVFPTPPDPAVVGSEVEGLIEMEEVAKAFQETVEATLEAAGVEWSWHRFYGDPATILIERSRLADVVILSAEDSWPPVSSVALHSRAPILAVPKSDPSFFPDQPALIAWNGSSPAADAVRGAMPMLDHMAPVQILSIDDDSAAFPASLVQQYLYEHSIRSDAHLRPSDPEKHVADAIIEQSDELGTGMIVAGAFGHNRLREMLLGSVTRELLRKSPVPLLLAH
jgi:nucleotide-binding universal stress UspA family protein